VTLLGFTIAPTQQDEIVWPCPQQDKGRKMTEILKAMTAPTVDVTPFLPRRTRPKGLLPSTWIERTMRGIHGLPRGRSRG